MVRIHRDARWLFAPWCFMPPSALPAISPVPVLAAWGRIAKPGSEWLVDDLEGASLGANLSRGLGRSYGDSSLPASCTDRVVATRRANRIVSVDAGTGVLRAEAGLTLAEINRLFIPRGLFTPVTPGTKFVTLGGMVASDVHGKNHHVEGCFGAHVRALKMRLADGSLVETSPSSEPDLFYGTLGGMGLLGHVLEVEFTLKPIASPWIWMESQRVTGLEEFMESLGRAAPAWPMTVGWIDCVSLGKNLGRGILIAGRWAEKDEAPPVAPDAPRGWGMPIDFPNAALNHTSALLFNTAYYWKHWQRSRTALVSPEPFFYPLDAVHDWNRVYGSRGFTQYQCVIPRACGAVAVREFMERLTRFGTASPLCVIKDCGPEGKGTLSFPLEGTSIAVDMPVSAGIQRVVDQLNEFVIATGGRIYLTKDAFTRPEHFRAMEPRLPAFEAAREKYDPSRRLRSAQSVRLFGDRTS